MATSSTRSEQNEWRRKINFIRSWTSYRYFRTKCTIYERRFAEQEIYNNWINTWRWKTQVNQSDQILQDFGRRNHIGFRQTKMQNWWNVTNLTRSLLSYLSIVNYVINDNWTTRYRRNRWGWKTLEEPAVFARNIKKAVFIVLW